MVVAPVVAQHALPATPVADDLLNTAATTSTPGTTTSDTTLPILPKRKKTIGELRRKRTKDGRIKKRQRGIDPVAGGRALLALAARHDAVEDAWWGWRGSVARLARRMLGWPQDAEELRVHMSRPAHSRARERDVNAAAASNDAGMASNHPTTSTDQDGGSTESAASSVSAPPLFAFSQSRMIPVGLCDNSDAWAATALKQAGCDGKPTSTFPSSEQTSLVASATPRSKPTKNGGPARSARGPKRSPQLPHDDL